MTPLTPKHALTLLATTSAALLLAQQYSADPTNTFPIARSTWLRGPRSLNDSSLLVYLPLASTGAAPGGTIFSDYSGNGNSATFGGSAFAGTTYRGKISPWGPYWNKSNRNIALTSAVAIPSPAFSVSAWVTLNSPASGGYTRIAEGDYTKTFFLGTDTTGTKWAFIVANSSATACTSTAAAATGQWSSTGASSWTMITGTYDGTNERLYVNGVLQNTCAQASTAFVTTAKAIGLGGCAVSSYCGSGSSYSGWLDGQMQDFRLSSRLWSSAEILDLFNAENK